MNDVVARKAYFRFFGSAAAGVFFTVTGAIGYQTSRHISFVNKARWESGPIWWQVALGLACLLLAVYFYRRITHDPGY